jgi:hypothetical protein
MHAGPYTHPLQQGRLRGNRRRHVPPLGAPPQHLQARRRRAAHGARRLLNQAIQQRRLQQQRSAESVTGQESWARVRGMS